MSYETAQAVLRSAQPKGLKRLVLVLIALDATDQGLVAFGATDQARLAAQASMDTSTRFLRIVEELRDEGYVSLDSGVLTVYAGGTTGGDGLEPLQTDLLQGLPEKDGGGSERGGGIPQIADSAGSAVTEVLTFYAETFPANSDKFGEDDRREVRAALQIRTVKQLKEAILGNKASNYHQGENEHNKKYNRISHIFRPKKGKKSRAEVIDFFIELHRAAVANTGTIKSSADPTVMQTRKEEVRRAHRLRNDSEAQERGRRAVEWLAEHGIKTTFRPDGYPLWIEEEDGG